MTDATYPTTCWECSTCCGALATVRDGRVVDFAPNRDNPYSKGAFCIKGIRGAPGITYGANRLLHPMRRTGARGDGKWARVSWDEALDEMADGLARVRQKYGPEAIVGATSGAYFSRSLILALTLRSIGSPNWMINQDLCGGCRAVSARVMGLNITRGEDIDNTRCALIVGRNPSIADPVEWAALKAAKKRGARIVVIDPKRTQAAQMADIWLAPKIGTDAALALAMVHVLIAEGLYDKAFVARWCHGFDALAERAAQYPPDVAASIAGVPAEQIVAAARMYADWALDLRQRPRHRRLQRGRADVSRLSLPRRHQRQRRPPRRQLAPAHTARLRSYIDLLHMPEFRLDAATEARTIGADRFPLWAGPKGWQTACHNPSVIEAMLTGRPYPVRALYASGVNILVTYPDTRRTMEALRSLDFVAVAAHAMTPTAEFADIVLPKTTTLEEEEVSFMPSGPTVLFTRAVVPPQGEARSEIDIALPLLAKMAERQAVTQHLLPWRSQREFNTYLLGDSGIRIEDLERTGYAQVSPEPAADRPFATPTTKIELFSTTMAEPRPRPAAGLRSAEPRALARGRDPAISAAPRHRRSREELPPLALPRSGVGDQGLARPAPHHASRHGARPGPRRRRLGAARGGARQGRLPPARQAHRHDAAQRCQHGDGLVAAVRPRARAWRPRRQHQRRACLRRSVGSRLRLLGRPRPPLPRRADRGVTACILHP